jgi:hypothetical protein
VVFLLFHIVDNFFGLYQINKEKQIPFLWRELLLNLSFFGHICHKNIIRTILK